LQPEETFEQRLERIKRNKLGVGRPPSGDLRLRKQQTATSGQQRMVLGMNRNIGSGQHHPTGLPSMAGS